MLSILGVRLRPPRSKAAQYSKGGEATMKRVTTKNALHKLAASQNKTSYNPLLMFIRALAREQARRDYARSSEAKLKARHESRDIRPLLK